MEQMAEKLLNLMKCKKTLELEEKELLVLVQMIELSAKIEILEELKADKILSINKEIEESRKKLKSLFDNAGLIKILKEDGNILML